MGTLSSDGVPRDCLTSLWTQGLPPAPTSHRRSVLPLWWGRSGIGVRVQVSGGGGGLKRGQVALERLLWESAWERDDENYAEGFRGPVPSVGPATPAHIPLAGTYHLAHPAAREAGKCSSRCVSRKCSSVTI